ncbi:MAG: 3-phosphoshikimate 1-carboxyvinyltransferase [Verrucomicrobiota bacterium]
MSDLPVIPFRRAVNAVARVPGSKSISNRALILALLSEKTVTLKNLLHSQDTEVMRNCFGELGVSVTEPSKGTVVIEGGAEPVRSKEANLFVENAGTVARFLPAVLSLLPRGEFFFDGSDAMRERPMVGLLDSLQSLGSDVQFKGRSGFFPFILRANGWSKKTLVVDASQSSQILSALLLSGTRAPHSMRFELSGETVSKPFVQMTLRMIQQFGGRAVQDDNLFDVTPGLPGPEKEEYEIEPDATAASYFFALPLAVGGTSQVHCIPEQSLQGDLEFLKVLERIGFTVNRQDQTVSTTLIGQPSASDSDFNAFSDTFLTLAALAPLIEGTTRIRGISHTRHQETDRVSAMANELRKLGQIVEEDMDSLTITSDRSALTARTKEAPLTVETYEDHRIAMSFAILASHDLHGDGRPWISIHDPDCCRKTFPNFFDELARLRSISNS